MKCLLSFLLTILFLLSSFTNVDAKEFCLKQGTLFKVMNIREISSALVDEGDTVSVLATEPTYIGNSTLFPANTIFEGYVQKINEPIEGVNAAMKIKMTKVITPENKTYQINGYLTTGQGISMGGNSTPVKYYVPIPHYIEDIGGAVASYMPTNMHYMGQNLLIKAGAELFVVLDSDFVFKQ